MHRCPLLLLTLALACNTAEPGDETSTSGPAGSSGGTTAPTSGGEASSTDDTGDVALRGACPRATRVGGFELAMEAGYTAFSGAVADGVVPITVLEPVGEGGGCVLLRRNNPFCDPPCQPGTTCDFDGACIPYPTNHDVGAVTVTGLVQPLEVAPVMPTFDYFDTSLMHPAFAPGAALELSAAGGDYAAFVLRGEGVAMIAPTSATLTMVHDQPLAVAWTPGDGGAARVRVELNIDQHGNTPVRLVCEADDAGALTIPRELISQLIGFGISGFPSAQYYRETVDSVDLEPGCVEFTVHSHVQTLLSVEGHIPCDSPDDCPDGQVCDLPVQTCK
jgi:hypothetical protein